MRNHLGVLAGLIALCVMSWAQAPAPAQAPDQTPAPAQSPAQGQSTSQPSDQSPPEATPIPTPAHSTTSLPAKLYPRMELFAGGSYAEAGLFNAGHWAGLPGWDASLGLNLTNWLGFIVEGGQYFGTSKIPVGTPAPFEENPCGGSCTGSTFNVDTREYNILFGAQFSRRKYERWTPFGEVLYGHQGARGVENFPTGSPATEVGTGRALVAGAGLDYKITPRLALRLKADYFQTATDFAALGKEKQDNFRFSVGVVFRNVKKKKRKLEDETQVEP